MKPVPTALLAAALPLLAPIPLSAAESCANQPLRPVMATHTMPPYPELSVMTAEAGTSLLNVFIGADGVPTKVSVVTSSGSIRLDQAAAQHVKDMWRWNAPVVDCKPAAVETRVSVKWDLRDNPTSQALTPSVFMDPKDYPEGARKRHEQGKVGMMVIVSAQGQVTPMVLQSSGFPELDERSVAVMSRWHFSAALLEGRPLTTPVFLTSVWNLDGQPK